MLPAIVCLAVEYVVLARGASSRSVILVITLHVLNVAETDTR